MRLLLSLLSSHSSVLMLNFQNFYITKGPTTSAGEKAGKYIIRAREPRRAVGREHRSFCRFLATLSFCARHFSLDFCPFFAALVYLIRQRERIIQKGVAGSRECQPPSRDWFMTRRYFISISNSFNIKRVCLWRMHVLCLYELRVHGCCDLWHRKRKQKCVQPLHTCIFFF